MPHGSAQERPGNDYDDSFDFEELFSDDLASDDLDEQPNHGENEVFKNVQEFALATSPLVKIAEELHAAVASSNQLLGYVSLEYVGSWLAKYGGYSVRLRSGLGAPCAKGYLRKLKYAYLVCGGVKDGRPVEVVIDPFFRDSFACSPSTSRYTKLVKALPAMFVGTLDTLSVLISLMGGEVVRNYHDVGLSVPPWREPKSIISRWLPERFNDTVLTAYDLSVIRAKAVSLYKPSLLTQVLKSGEQTTKPITKRIVHGFDVAYQAQPGEAQRPNSPMRTSLLSKPTAQRGVAKKSLDQLLPSIRTVKLYAG